MKVIKTVSRLGGVPDYYSIYESLWAKYERTGDEQVRSLAYHYARVAEEMGQAFIEDDDSTVEIVL